MNKINIILLVGYSLLPGYALALDAEAVKTQATTVCASCHGIKGVSASEAIPNLQGQKAQYLANALKAYRDGRRKAPLMNNMAMNLGDEEIDALSTYFAGMTP